MPSSFVSRILPCVMVFKLNGEVHWGLGALLYEDKAIFFRSPDVFGVEIFRK